MVPKGLARNLVRYFFIVLAAGICTGCASVKVIHRDVDFSAARLAQGGVGIAAVTGLGGGEYLLAEGVSKVLVVGFALRFPNVRVLSLEEMKPLLQGKGYDSFLKDFSEWPVVRSEDFDMLNLARPSVRFVILANVCQDEGWLSDSASEREHYRQVKNSESGKYETEYDYSDYEVARSGYRSMVVKFIICDLERRRQVWIATGSGDETDSRRASSISWYPKAPGSPGVPSRIGIMEGIVDRTLKRLVE